MKTICRKEYNEILELLKFIPSYDYLKIPDEKIEFFKTFSVKDYDFKIEDINNINVSREAYAIYTSLYRDYIATDKEKSRIDEILLLNQKKKHQKYDSKEIFENRNTEQSEELIENKNISFIQKIKNKIKNIFK